MLSKIDAGIVWFLHMKHLLTGAFWLIGPLALILTAVHHPTAEIYNDEELISLEGEIVLLSVGRPHSIFHVKVTDPQNNTSTWLAEWRGSKPLTRGEDPVDSLAIGKRVMLCGNPARDPSMLRVHVLDVIVDSVHNLQTTNQRFEQAVTTRCN